MTTRELNTFNLLNDKLRIEVVDEPGPGGANHTYIVSSLSDDGCVLQRFPIMFQKGGVKEAGVNGLTHEVLLEIVCDRLRCFQAGPLRCEENAQALVLIEYAQNWLFERTKARMARGVEGKSIT